MSAVFHLLRYFTWLLHLATSPGYFTRLLVVNGDIRVEQGQDGRHSRQGHVKRTPGSRVVSIVYPDAQGTDYANEQIPQENPAEHGQIAETGLDAVIVDALSPSQ